ncbi:sulfotransferase family 2 domain-containing protein [Falsiruegeria mediterranea]
MIISTGRNYIFVHIPKTGGTSLSLALEARAMKDDILLGDTPKALRRRPRAKALADQARGRLWKHATLADMEGVVAGDILDQMFVFTLVRNPWDRAVSYYHWLREQSFEHPAVTLAKALEFKPFLLHPDTQAGFRQMPTSAYVRRSDGREQCQAFVRMEHLAQDLKPVEAHLGFSLDIPHINRSRRGEDYRVYFDDETAQAIQDMCAPDIQRFGYAFDG